jgi:hypothetical protein
MRYVATVLIVALVSAVSASAHEVKHGKINVVHPWTMERDSGGPADASVYMKIRNGAQAADRLIGARCSAAAGAELTAADGLAGGPIEVGAKGELILTKGGPHLVLRGLSGTLRAYSMVPVTLVFEKAGEVAIEVMVEARD